MQNRATRSGSTSSVSSVDGINKRPREEGASLADDNVSSISDLWVRIQRMFEETNTKIEKKIDSSNTKLENRIIAVEGHLSALRMECTENVNKLASTVTEVRCEVRSASLRLDGLEKANDLILSGVPYASNENLKQMFHTLAESLSYMSTDVPIVDLKRLARMPIATGTTPPIICQFAFRNVRNEFYQRYLKTRNLTLRHLGFESGQRIYLNENLTQQARSIRTEAIKLKKDGGLQKVFTKNGVVFVQTADGTAAEPVYDVNHLFEKIKPNLSK